MVPDEVVIATSNVHKIAEISAIFDALGMGHVRLTGLDLAATELAPPAEDGATFAENARIKAMYYTQHIGKACLSDDSGLCVDALGGAPGILSSRYADTDEARIARLLAELEAVGAASPAQRKAHFECAACLALPNGGTFEANGACDGCIASTPSGTSGFGYDPIFYLRYLNNTFAQLSAEEKNRISHRRNAIGALLSMFQCEK